MGFSGLDKLVKIAILSHFLVFLFPRLDGAASCVLVSAAAAAATARDAVAYMLRAPGVDSSFLPWAGRPSHFLDEGYVPGTDRKCSVFVGETFPPDFVAVTVCLCHAHYMNTHT